MDNGQTIEAICAHLNDSLFLTYKENKELYFIFRLKSFYLHAISKHLLNHKMFDMESHPIYEGFKIPDLAIINMLFEIGRLEDIESNDYNTLSKSSYDKILWVEIIDNNMIIVLTSCGIAYRLLLSCLIIFSIKNSSNTISLNDLIYNISNNGSSSSAYNDLIYINSLLNNTVILQTLYDVVVLNANNVYYRRYNSLLNLLIIFRSNKNHIKLCIIQKALVQNVKTKRDNKYTNKELRFIMIKLSDFYVTSHDVSSIKNNIIVLLQFNQFINFRQYQNEVIIITLLPDLFVQEQRPLLNSQRISEAALSLKEISIASTLPSHIPIKTDDEISSAIRFATGHDSTNNIASVSRFFQSLRVTGYSNNSDEPTNCTNDSISSNTSIKTHNTQYICGVRYCRYNIGYCCYNRSGIIEL